MSIPKLEQQVMRGTLTTWLEYAIKQSHNTIYFRVYNDPETGTEKTDWTKNYYKGRTLLSDLRAYFA